MKFASNKKFPTNNHQVLTGVHGYLEGTDFADKISYLVGRPRLMKTNKSQYLIRRREESSTIIGRWFFLKNVAVLVRS